MVNGNAIFADDTRIFRVVRKRDCDVGIITVLFTGTRLACLAYMDRCGGRRPDLKYELLYPNGQVSSWML